MRQKTGYRMQVSPHVLQTRDRRQRTMGKVFDFFLLLHALGFMLCVLYSPAAYADDNPLNRMRDETLSYFEPLTGKITKAKNKKVVLDLGTKDAVKVGMRFNILREESHFKHPVTKEPLGKLESQIG